MEFSWSVLLSKNTDQMRWDLEPLGNFLYVRNSGTYSHYPDFLVDTDDPTDDGLKDGSSIFHVEHVNFVDQEQVKLF